MPEPNLSNKRRSRRRKRSVLSHHALNALAESVLIQIDHPQDELTMQGAQHILSSTGITLDEGYGPYLIAPAIGRYVVRGTAMAAAVDLARKLPDVQIFVDSDVDAAGV